MRLLQFFKGKTMRVWVRMVEKRPGYKRYVRGIFKSSEREGKEIG